MNSNELTTLEEIDAALMASIDNCCWYVLSRLVCLHARERIRPSPEVSEAIWDALEVLLALDAWRATEQVLGRAKDPSGAADLRIVFHHMRRRLLQGNVGRDAGC